MKTRDLLIISLFAILWEMLLGHTSLFGVIDLSAVLGVLILNDLRIRNIVLLFVLGVIISLIAVETIGLISLALVLSMIIVLFIDRFSEVLTEGMNVFASLLFLSIYKVTLILGNFLLFENLDLHLLKFILFLVTHLLLVYILKYFLKNSEKDTSFIV